MLLRVEIKDVNDNWVEGTPVDGQLYRQVFKTGERVVVINGVPTTEDVLVYVEGTFIDDNPISTKQSFLIANQSITSNNQPVLGLNNVFYAIVGDTLQLQSDIVDDQGVLQTQIDQTALGYPPVLKMPVVKFAGGINGTIVDEVYFNVTLVNGVLTATGVIPSSGDWKLLTTRLNQSLDSIGADWEVSTNNITFLA